MAEHRDIYNARIAVGDTPEQALETTVTLVDILNRHREELRRERMAERETERQSRRAYFFAAVAIAGLMIALTRLYG